MMISHQAEDILEALWIATEEKGDHGALLESLGLRSDDAALEELDRLAYVDIQGERVHLREEGREEAQMAVRRHRLAERLTMDIFDIRGPEGDAQACEFEHLLRGAVDTKLCTLLNHPSTCPHGRPIPPGRCCRDARQQGAPGVVALTELKPGESGEIAYLSTAEPKKMQKLMSMGVLPGNLLQLKRAYPSYIFRIGHSEFAVDQELAREIFVRAGQGE